MTRIVIGYDGSEQSHDALALGAMLARSMGARIVLATAFPHMLPPVDYERYATGLARESDPLVADADSRLPESARAEGFERRATGGVPAAQGLREIAKSEDAHLIVVGSTHRGAVGRVLAGSVGEDLLADAPCPVAIAPRGHADAESPSLEIVGVAFDATEEAGRALRFAAALARTASARLHVFGVVEPVELGGVVYSSTAEGPDPRFSREALGEEVDRAIGALPGAVGVERSIVSGKPDEVLVGAGRRVVDTMVAGTHGYGRLLRLLLGSVATEMARTAPWPVVVVPPTARIEFDRSRPSGNESVAGAET